MCQRNRNQQWDVNLNTGDSPSKQLTPSPLLSPFHTPISVFSKAKSQVFIHPLHWPLDVFPIVFSM